MKKTPFLIKKHNQQTKTKRRTESQEITLPFDHYADTVKPLEISQIAQSSKVPSRKVSTKGQNRKKSDQIVKQILEEREEKAFSDNDLKSQVGNKDIRSSQLL